MGVLVLGRTAILPDALGPVLVRHRGLELSAPGSEDWLRPRSCKSELKWRNWWRQMLLLIYLRPLWHSAGMYLQGCSNLQDPSKKKKKPDRQRHYSSRAIRCNGLTGLLYCRAATQELKCLSDLGFQCVETRCLTRRSASCRNRFGNGCVNLVARSGIEALGSCRVRLCLPPPRNLLTSKAVLPRELCSPSGAGSLAATHELGLLVSTTRHDSSEWTACVSVWSFCCFFACVSEACRSPEPCTPFPLL